MACTDRHQPGNYKLPYLHVTQPRHLSLCRSSSGLLPCRCPGPRLNRLLRHHGGPPFPSLGILSSILLARPPFFKIPQALGPSIMPTSLASNPRNMVASESANPVPPSGNASARHYYIHPYRIQIRPPELTSGRSLLPVPGPRLGWLLPPTSLRLPPSRSTIVVARGATGSCPWFQNSRPGDG